MFTYICEFFFHNFLMVVENVKLAVILRRMKIIKGACTDAFSRAEFF